MTTAEILGEATAIVNDLIELRHDRGLTQAQVAKMCGISTPAIANFERCRYLPGLFVLLRYADAVGADLTFVMRRSGQ